MSKPGREREKAGRVVKLFSELSPEMSWAIDGQDLKKESLHEEIRRERSLIYITFNTNASQSSWHDKDLDNFYDKECDVSDVYMKKDIL